VKSKIVFKVKKDYDLVLLESRGFKKFESFNKSFYFYGPCYLFSYIVISCDSREFTSYVSDSSRTLSVFYDLVKSGIVEKVYLDRKNKKNYYFKEKRRK
jgi:hypothetical protein